jgi:hypothetical protein
MATSLLLFAGQYAPTYRARMEQLENLSTHTAGLPLDMCKFIARVRQCTELKLRPEQANLPFSFWADAIADAKALWKWELEKLRARRRGFPSLVRGDQCIGCESFSQWLRGWLHLLRHAGWHRSWRSWPRWLRLSAHGSPRYLIYWAAARWFFDFSERLHKQDPSTYDQLRRTLPLADSNPNHDWRDLGRLISRNYYTLLVSSRS